MIPLWSDLLAGTDFESLYLLLALYLWPLTLCSLSSCLSSVRELNFQSPRIGQEGLGSAEELCNLECRCCTCLASGVSSQWMLVGTSPPGPLSLGIQKLSGPGKMFPVPTSVLQFMHPLGMFSWAVGDFLHELPTPCSVHSCTSC